MDGGGGGGGGGGPAPFLIKTYEMVDDSSTDRIVSWSAGRKSFVVWNPPEFARVLLPSYFKHNNFSSFIRQLNTYGFRKIDPERWEFANEDFVKNQKHNLKNIHRRKPIHSHSQPQGSIDPERAAFEEEIDRLSRENAVLKGNILAYEEQQSAATLPLENVTQRIVDLEQRQEKLLSFLDKAVQKPEFVVRLAQKLESMDFSAYSKKRRLPEADYSQSVQEIILVDNQSSSRPESGNTCPQDFCDKLRLELSPTVSDINLLSRSTQSSNEDAVNPLGRLDGWPRDEHTRTTCFSCPSETLELSDTGASFTLKMESSLPGYVGPENPKHHSLQHNLVANMDDDCHISCLLNLSLASSPLEPNKSRNLATMPHSGQETYTEPRPNADENDISHWSHTEGTYFDDPLVPSSQDSHSKKQDSSTARTRVNDVFWEQFLTEKPGCSDTEEASSGYRPNAYIEQEEKNSTNGVSSNTKGMEHLTL